MKLKKFSKEEVWGNYPIFEKEPSDFKDEEFIRITETGKRTFIKFDKFGYQVNFYYEIIEATDDELMELYNIILKVANNYLKEHPQHTMKMNELVHRPIWSRKEDIWMREKFGADKVQYWLDNVEMKQLFNCMDAFSSYSLSVSNMEHRDKDLNILEAILQEDLNHLYPSVTYGVCPNATCTSQIGDLTGRKYNNCEIASYLIERKANELKEWVLDNHNFSERETRLLHYFKDGD